MQHHAYTVLMIFQVVRSSIYSNKAITYKLWLKHVLVALCPLHTAAFFFITIAIDHDHGKPMYVVFIIVSSLNENLICILGNLLLLYIH